MRTINRELFNYDDFLINQLYEKNVFNLKELSFLIQINLLGFLENEEDPILNYLNEEEGDFLVPCLDEEDFLSLVELLRFQCYFKERVIIGWYSSVEEILEDYFNGTSIAKPINIEENIFSVFYDCNDEKIYKFPNKPFGEGGNRRKFKELADFFLKTYSVNTYGINNSIFKVMFAEIAFHITTRAFYGYLFLLNIETFQTETVSSLLRVKNPLNCFDMNVHVDFGLVDDIGIFYLRRHGVFYHFMEQRLLRDFIEDQYSTENERKVVTKTIERLLFWNVIDSGPEKFVEGSG